MKKGKKPTVHQVTFDDSKFGHEIKESWGFSMLDAMWYCQAREAGFRQLDCMKAWFDYQTDLDNQIQELIKN